MARTNSLLRELPAQALTSSTVAEGDTVVVQLWGEHDGSTVPVLTKILASAAGLERSHLVVDLSKVQFINSATVRVFIASSETLEQAERTFSLRSPSRSARRVIDLCGASPLVETAPARAAPAASVERFTWPTVPAAGS